MGTAMNAETIAMDETATIDTEITDEGTKKVRHVKSLTKCVCGSPECDKAMKMLLKLNKERHAYFNIPAKVIPEDQLRSKPGPACRLIRHSNERRHERFLAALGPEARERSNDKTYSDKTEFVAKVSMLQCREEIRSTQCKSRIVSPVRVTRSGKTASTNPSNEIEELQLEVNIKEQKWNEKETVLKQQLKDVKEQLKKMETDITAKEKRMLEQELEVEKFAKAVSVKEFKLESHGLSRLSLTSKSFYKTHINAATTLFGFSSWKEAVLYVNALHGLKPPMKSPWEGAVLDFEWCLAAKMRINCGFSYRTIALILGLKSGSYVGQKIKYWIKCWGDAGRDLSILNITAEFLSATCPEAYKREKLETVCAVPDGKDYKIYMPRQNTLFTRACFSDKVKASAIRGISWSTPMGLSFEHTDLYLARVTEKRIVELWGPRLKKCPRGWSMLSDRGFADTARFYPFMNQQKTPKFLNSRKQFSAAEVAADRIICKLRYTCEVAFARVTETAGLKDVISGDFFVLLDAMNHWGHANVNLHAPLLAPSK